MNYNNENNRPPISCSKLNTMLLCQRKKIMHKDQIEIINKWFRQNEDFGTYAEEEEYCVASCDVPEFCDFLRKNCPDLINFECRVGESGILFYKSDLQNATEY